MRSNDGQQLKLVNMRGERVALGPFRREQIPLYLQWVNDFENMRTYGLPVPVTEEQAVEVFEASVRSSDSFRFVIYDQGSMNPIGYTSLVDVDFRNHSGEYEIMIGDREYHGKGYGTEVTRLMLHYGFSWLGLHNIMLEVAGHNEAGIRAYQRAGFQEIGRRREAYLMGGEWHDKVYMDVSATDFEAPVFGKISKDS